MTITQAILKEWLHYDPDTGHFRWLQSPNWSLKEGDIAGYKASNGYIRIVINKKQYRAHRLVWLYIYGTFPENDLDHINRVKDDNRFCNLRDATRQENCFNKDKSKRNKSGFKGVCWNKTSERWCAQASINGRTRYLGCSKTPDGAAEIYQIFAAKHHGEFLSL